nr:replication protein A 70 kDa DNA-binding subunit-like [Drosophila bipectinata]
MSFLNNREFICNVSYKLDPAGFIMARVTHKTEIKAYDNETSGKVFLIYLQDETGEIIATVFNDLCNTFFNQIETDQVYIFEHFEVNDAKKEYILVPHPFTINFLKCTKAFPIGPIINSIPGTTYNLKSISEIYEKPKGDAVDTIGICTEVGELIVVGDYHIREIELMDYDDYDGVIILTLWNEAAKEFNGKKNDVILVKGARIKEHNEVKKINLDWYAKMKINPNLPEAKSLIEWYNHL